MMSQVTMLREGAESSAAEQARWQLDRQQLEAAVMAAEAAVAAAAAEASLQLTQAADQAAASVQAAQGVHYL